MPLVDFSGVVFTYHSEKNPSRHKPGHERTRPQQNLVRTEPSQIRTNKTSTKTDQKSTRAAPGQSRPWPDQNLEIAETVRIEQSRQETGDVQT